MKKVLYMLLACLFVCGLSACKGGEDESGSTGLDVGQSASGESSSSLFENSSSEEESSSSEDASSSEDDSSAEESSSSEDASSSEDDSSEVVHQHAWGDGDITTAPLCETVGVKTYTCACGEIKTEEIPVLGHNYIQEVCDNCGDERRVSQGLEYELNDDEASYSVIGLGDCTDTEIVIPSTYNDLPVTHIAEGAFEDETSFMSIDIADSVISIGEYAFSCCESLVSVEIGAGVAIIEESAFEDCIVLTYVVLPDGVTSIGEYAFAYCESLTGVEIGKSVTNIGEDAFYACILLESITVAQENTVYQSIDGNLYSKDGKTLFKYANGKAATSFSISNTVTMIGDGAFEDATALVNVEIPNSVTTIGDAAFSWCTSLAQIEIPDSVTKIGNGAFYQCESLTSVEIPDSVTWLGESAFSTCWKLTSVKLSNSLTEIVNDTFGECVALERVVIPDSVTSIGNGAFKYCSNLTEVVIGNSVEYIGNNAFYACGSLESIVIPHSVTSIGFNVFYRVTTVYYEGTAEEWENIWNVDDNETLTNATKYYYSETEVSGCWHYVDGVPTIW